MAELQFPAFDEVEIGGGVGDNAFPAFDEVEIPDFDSVDVGGEPKKPRIGIRDTIKNRSQAQEGVVPDSTAHAIVGNFPFNKMMRSADQKAIINFYEGNLPDYKKKPLDEGARRYLGEKGVARYEQESDADRLAGFLERQGEFAKESVRMWRQFEEPKATTPEEREASLRNWIKRDAERELKDRIEAKRAAGKTLDEHERSIWNKMVVGAAENVGYQAAFTVHPGVALATAFADRTARLSTNEYDVDNDGNLYLSKAGDDEGTAAIKGLAGAAAETAIEVYGGKVVGKLLSKSARAILRRVGKKAPVTANLIGRAIKNYLAIAKVTKLDDPIVETWFEEYPQALVDSGIGLDLKQSEMEGKPFAERMLKAHRDFDPTEVMLSMAFLMGGQAAMSTASATMDHATLNRNLDNSLKLFGGLEDADLKGVSTKDKILMARRVAGTMTPEKVEGLARHMDGKARQALKKMYDRQQFYQQAQAEGVEPTFELGGDGRNPHVDTKSGIGIIPEDGKYRVVNRDGADVGVFDSAGEAIAEAKKQSQVNVVLDQQRQKKADYVRLEAERLAGGMPVRIFNTESEMLQEIPEIGQSPDYQAGITGVRHKGGMVLILDNLVSPSEVVRTIMHEGGAHEGIRRALGDKAGLDQFLGNLAGEQFEIGKRRLKLGGQEFADQLTEADEALATVYEHRLADPTAYQKSVAWLHNQLRRVAPNVKYTDADIEVLMADAQRRVMDARGDVSVDYIGVDRGYSGADAAVEDARARMSQEARAAEQARRRAMADEANKPRVAPVDDDAATPPKAPAQPQQRGMNQKERRGALIAGMEQEVSGALYPVEDDVRHEPDQDRDPAAQVETQAGDTAQQAVRQMESDERLKARYPQEYQDALSAVDGDAENAIGLLREQAKAMEESRRVSEQGRTILDKLDNKRTLTPQDIRFLTANDILGPDLYKLGYRRDKSTGEWRNIDAPADDADLAPTFVAPDTSVTAGQTVTQSPSEAQKKAGNYKKAHVAIDGHDITIENPVGSTRSGKDRNGDEWHNEMKTDYGYIKGTVGHDKDHLDVVIKPGYKGGSGSVFVVDQIDPDTGKFDEHKVVFGADTAHDAMSLYNSNYAAGWKGGAGVTELSDDQFKEWAYATGNRGPRGGRLSSLSPVASKAETEAPIQTPQEAPAAPPVSSQAPAAESPATPAADGKAEVVEYDPDSDALADAENRGLIINNFPLSKIKFDPLRFQYKLLHGQTGATGSLKGVKKYDPVRGGVISVWRDPGDGEVYVINGHNRASKAIELGERGHAVQFLRVATAKEARTYGALINISEGRGSIIDAAKFFRDSGITQEQIESENLPLSETRVSRGLALSKLVQSLFDSVVSGEMDEGLGVVIGEALPDHREQLQMMELLKARGGRISLAVVREIADIAKNAPTVPESDNEMPDLFGEMSAKDKKLIVEKARVISAVNRRLSSDKNLFAKVASEKAAERLGVAGNKIDPETNKEISKEAETIQFVFQKLKHSDLSPILNNAALELYNGQNINQVVKQIFPSISDAVSTALGRRVGEGSKSPKTSVPARGDSKAATAATGAGRSPDLKLEAASPEQIAEESRKRAEKEKIEAAAAKPITGTAGDLTADLFGEQEGETPLFNARRDGQSTVVEILDEGRMNQARQAAGVPVVDDVPKQPTTREVKTGLKGQTKTVPVEIPTNGEPTTTIVGRMDMVEFERMGYEPNEVTRQNWIDLQRAERRRLGQREEGDNPNAPWAEYEELHRDSVKRALAKGDVVDERILADYPELQTREVKTGRNGETKTVPVEAPPVRQDVAAMPKINPEDSDIIRAFRAAMQSETDTQGERADVRRAISETAWSLMGPRNIMKRQAAIEALTGRRPPQGKAGVEQLKRALTAWHEANHETADLFGEQEGETPLFNARRDGQSTVKDTLTTEPAAKSQPNTPRFPRGAMATTVHNEDGIAYTGRIVSEDSGKETVTIRATKERKKGLKATAGDYGLDKQGRQITKDVTVPAELVRVIDAVDSGARRTAIERAAMDEIDREVLADLRNNIGDQTTAVDQIDKVVERQDADDADPDEAYEGTRFRRAVTPEQDREYDAVVAAHTNADGTRKASWMLAPNWKPTNLTERQWVQVRTKAFKEWFGDWENDPKNASTVVDENGEPLAVYHGTAKDFTAFDLRKMEGRNEGPGFYFTNNRAVASGYGRPMDVYLSLQKPMAYDTPAFNKKTLTRIMRTIATLENAGEGGDIRDGYLANFGDTYSKGIEGALREGVELVSADTSALDQISGLVGSGVSAEYVLRAVTDVTGYDGIVAKGFSNEGDESNTIYVAFRPEQIKSATGNVGTFDPANADIRFRLPGVKLDAEPVFFSQLRRTLEAKMPNRMTVMALRGLIDPSRSGVKADEIEWTGLKDFLDGKNPGDYVTKAEVLEAAKDVEIREVVKGAPDRTSEVEAWWNDEGGANEEKPYSELTPSERMDAVARYIDEVEPYTEDATKFSQYQLPGGENYRELLLTLPPKETRQFFIAYKDGATFGQGYATEDAARADMASEFAGRTDIEVRPGVGDRSTTTKTPENFKSSHFNEPNILVHVRFNERTAANGDKTLFLEEVQSDWHQAGREKGYRRAGNLLPSTPKSYADVVVGDNILGWGRVSEIQGEGNDRRFKVGGVVISADKFSLDKVQNRNERFGPSENLNAALVPDAPFKDTSKGWARLAFKRMLRWAAENGFARIAWTTGEQQAERYDLSKQVDTISATKFDDGTYSVLAEKGGRSVITEKVADKKALTGLVGKELANKIDAQDVDIEGSQTYSGLDLKVGGEGMRTFYDQILPSIANDIGKKFGARAEDVGINETTGLTAPQKYVGPELSYKEVETQYKRRDINATAQSQLRDILREMNEGVSFQTAANKTSPHTARILGGDIEYGKLPNINVHSLPVTPAMRESVMQEQPRFRLPGVTLDAEYMEAVEKGDRGGDNLVELLRKTEKDERDKAVAAWLERNPETAERLEKMVVDRAKKAGLRSVWHGTTATKYVDGEGKTGSQSAKSQLEQMAIKFGASAPMWGKIADILESWIEMGQAHHMGATVADAVTARNLTAEARGARAAGHDVIAFSVFNLPDESLEFGVHLGTKQQASMRGSPFRFFVDIKNPIRLQDAGRWAYNRVLRDAMKAGVNISESEISETESNQAARDLLIRKGVDGIVYKNEAEGRGDSYIVFSPSQIKSADAITLDDQGNVIPLSERFNEASDDVRFRLRSAAHALNAHPGTLKDTDFIPMSVIWNAQFDPYRNGANSRKTPIDDYEAVVGGWYIDDLRTDYGASIDQMLLLNPTTLEPSEWMPWTNEEGRGVDSDLYQEWLEDGKQPPPIKVLETEGGNLRISDGHRRFAAALRAGRPVLALVSPVGPSPSGGREFHSKKLIGMTLTDKIAKMQAEGKLPEWEGQPWADRVKPFLWDDGTRFRRASDAEYLAAVEAGDMETAQRMFNDRRQEVNNGNIKKPSLPVKDIERIVRDSDDMGYSVSDDDKKMLFADTIEYLKSKGIKKVDLYHVTSFNDPTTGGLKGTQVSAIGNTENVRENGVYAFLDPDDIDNGWNQILGTRDLKNTVVHFTMPVDELYRIHLDSNFNLTSGTYSGVRVNGDVTKESVVGRYRYTSKFADAVTYDDAGRVIPLSERFNPDTPDTRFRRASDAEYLAAVEAGDMETAQRMVDEMELRRLQPEWAHIPSAEMPNSRFKTAAQIDEPTLERIASQYERMADRAGIEPTDLRFHVGQGNAVVWSPYQSNDYVVGQFIGDVFAISHFAPETRRSGLLALQDLLHTGTPVVFAVPDKLASQLSRIGFKESRVIVPMMFRGEVQRKHVLVNHAFKEQHLRDLLSWYSIEMRSRGLTSSVAADAKMLPANPVARDDAGRVIPLSERFNEASDDIRFRRVTDSLAVGSSWDDVRFRRRTDMEPAKTAKAYKLFRVRDGKLYPLYVNANEPVPFGVWLDAEAGERTDTGKVKSKLGPLQYRPGWHAGDLPIATHIGLKQNPKDAKPSYRAPFHVWAEVEMAADVDWQPEADSRALKTKDGRPIASTAHITDQVPKNGFYRYKTNSNMTGNWMIGGSMKVNRIILDDEVKAINDAAGVADLPRQEPFDASSITDPDIRFRPGPRRAPVLTPDQQEVVRVAERAMERTPAPATRLAQAASATQEAPILGLIRWGMGQDVADKIDRKLGDFRIPVKRLYERVMEKGGKFNRDTMEYAALAEKRNSLFGVLADDMEKRFVLPMTKALRDGGWSLDDLNHYAQALHAPYFNRMIAEARGGREAPGRQPLGGYATDLLSALEDDGWAGKGLSDAKAKETVEWFERQAMSDKLREAASYLVFMNRRILDQRVADGLMARQQAETWKNLSPYYVPLRKMQEVEDGDVAAPAGRNLASREIKRAVGHFGALNENSVVNSLTQMDAALYRGLMNKERQNLWRFLEANPDPDSYVLHEAVPTRAVKVRNADGTFTVQQQVDQSFVRKASPHDKEGTIVPVKFDGDVKYIEFKGVNARTAARAVKENALQGRAFAASPFIRGLGHMFKGVRTIYAVDFMLRNGQSDSLDAALIMAAEGNGKQALEAVKAVPHAWKVLWQHENGRPVTGPYAELFDEYRRSGSIMSNRWVDSTGDNWLKVLEKEMGIVPDHSKPVQAVIAVKDGIERLNTMVELGTRFSVYAGMRKNGASVQDAADYARNITVDFEKRGELTPVLNSVYHFSNVAIQGNRRFMQAMLKNPARGARVVGSVFAAGFLTALWNMLGFDDDNDEYDKLKDYHKYGRIAVRIPGTNKMVQARFRGIPGWIYFQGVAAAETAFGKRTAGSFAMQAPITFLDTVNWLGDSSDLLTAILPPMLDPLAHFATNKLWTRRPLVPGLEYATHKPRSQLAYKSTPKVFKAVAEAINKLGGGDEVTKSNAMLDNSPEAYKYWWSFLTGSMLNVPTRSFDVMVRLAKGDDVPVKSVPFVRDFFLDMDDIEDNEPFYQAKTAFEEVQYRYKGYDERGERGKMGKLRRQHRYADRESIASERLKDMLRRIDDLKDRTDAATGERKEQLNQRRVEAQRQFIELIERYDARNRQP